MFVSFVFAVFFTLLQRVVQDAKAAINKDWVYVKWFIRKDI
jgi:hypothetical protein